MLGRIISFKEAPFSRVPLLQSNCGFQGVRVKGARVQRKGEAKKDGHPLTETFANLSVTGVRACSKKGSEANSSGKTNRVSVARQRRVPVSSKGIGIHRSRRGIVTWLILPVVICLSQRLSHACLSISTSTVKLRMAH